LQSIRGFVRDVLAPALLACWVAYIAYGAVAGAAGFRVLRKLEDELAVARAGLAEIEARREALERRADLLHPKSLDRDMIDERVRVVLGFARDGDIVVPRAEIERLLAGRSAPGG
jgi:cell division protein FtsB